MVSVCKTWSLPSDYISGLCSSKYDPARGQSTCPVCAMPIDSIDCDACARYPFRMITTSLPLAVNFFPAFWQPQPEIYHSIADVVALDMTKAEGCYWESPRMTVAKLTVEESGAHAGWYEYYSVVQKIGSMSGTYGDYPGTIGFYFNRWLSFTVDGDPVTTSNGVSTYDAVLYSGVYNSPVGNCYINALTLEPDLLSHAAPLSMYRLIGNEQSVLKTSN